MTVFPVHLPPLPHTPNNSPNCGKHPFIQQNWPPFRASSYNLCLRSFALFLSLLRECAFFRLFSQAHTHTATVGRETNCFLQFSSHTGGWDRQMGKESCPLAGMVRGIFLLLERVLVFKRSLSLSLSHGLCLFVVRYDYALHTAQNHTSQSSEEFAFWRFANN